jgi:hypothetical protein
MKPDIVEGSCDGPKSSFTLLRQGLHEGLLVFDAFGVENTTETSSARRNLIPSQGEQIFVTEH